MDNQESTVEGTLRAFDLLIDGMTQEDLDNLAKTPPNASEPAPEKEKLHIVPKGWGFEKWIVNNEKYCGKLLYIIKDRKCSVHFHKLKSETFFLQSGAIILRYGKLDDIKLKEVTLTRGDHFHVPQFLVHQMIALEDTELFEFSTQHFDEDSYRIEKGD